jgi:hypothetical protein
MLEFLRTYIRKSHCLLAVSFLLILAFFFVNNLGTVVDAFEVPDAKGTTGLETAAQYINNNYDKNFHEKYSFINLNGLIHSALGHRLMNDVVRLNNGHLTGLVERKDMSGNASNLIELKRQLDAMDIPLLYVQEPYKISKYDDQLPEGLEDYSNVDADQLVGLLKKGGVDVLDLRDEIVRDGLDHYSLFFPTDTHWKPQTALWGFQKISGRLTERYGFPIDPRVMDIDNFKKQEYKDAFLGQWGKRTGIPYAGEDDVTILTPAYLTRLSMSVPSKKIYREGTFEETMLDKARLDNSQPFLQYTMGVYLTGDRDLVIMKNEKTTSNRKILFIKDSFGVPVGAFLSLIAKEVDMLDLRHYKNGTLMEYIKKTKPDIVIFSYNPTMILRSDVFKFN